MKLTELKGDELALYRTIVDLYYRLQLLLEIKTKDRNFEFELEQGFNEFQDSCNGHPDDLLRDLGYLDVLYAFQKARKEHIMMCRVCGCTTWRGCKGGCYWVAPDLCSNCAGK